MIGVPFTVQAMNSCQAVFVSESQITTIQDVLDFTSAIGSVNMTGSRHVGIESTAQKISNRDTRFSENLDMLLQKYPEGTRAYEIALIKHHQEYMQRYKDPQVLQNLRSEALTKDLANRGAPIDPQLSGRENLNRISRANLQRMVEKFKLDDRFVEDPEIMEVVDSIRLLYKHNTNIYKTHGDVLLSSQQIYKYGLEGGVNSQLPFNKEFMKNDDHLFFTLEVVSTNVDVGNQATQYGKHAKTLDQKFAEENSWVSPYIMYPKDLATFGRSFIRGKYAGIEDVKAGVGNQYQYKSTAVADELKSMLSQFDFTLRDFETLVKMQIGTMLFNLKHHGVKPFPGSDGYPEVLASFKTQSATAFQKAIEFYVEYPLRLGRYELKVPVAIPSDKLKDL
jgi:hypothetical protein